MDTALPTDFVILGSDTDAGKTGLALLWLANFPGQAYWKPLESGRPSDSERMRQLLPEVRVIEPLLSFEEPVAPLLAARRSECIVPRAREIADARPDGGVVIETFGSPFSPLNETELQIELVRSLALPTVLVSSSAVGAVGRTLQTLRALESSGIRPKVVVLFGAPDAFAAEQIERHGRVPVVSLRPPETWDRSGILQAATEQRPVLAQLCLLLSPEPEIASWIEGDRRYIWHPYTPLRDRDTPLPVIGAQDEFLYLPNGERVIDGISSWWTILHRHRHPPLLDALHDALAQVDHVHFAGTTHPWAVAAAEQLLATAPWPDGRVFFSDNGSTAVEVALKMAVQFWQRRGEQRLHFVGFGHGYHGDTFGAMAVSRDPIFFGRFEPLLCRADIIPLDANRLDELLARRSGDVAAVIIEPLVQGAGGMRMHSPAELRALFDVTRRHDVLFIADEVMTAGRTGNIWAHQTAAITPDLICAAKTLAGGLLPLAATLVAPHVVAEFDTDDRRETFFHGHSFTAHPLACAVAAINWPLVRDTAGPLGQRLESFWRTSLQPLFDHPHIKEVRIRGSIAAVELRSEGGYLADVGRQMRQRCRAAGVLLRPLGDVLYAMPPLLTGEDSLAQIATAMIEAVSIG